MGSCVICGQKAIEMEALFFRSGRAFSVKLGKNYCVNCGKKRVNEIEKQVNGYRNPLLVLTALKHFEELEIIE